MHKINEYHSRTDAGVHALHSTVHVDLQRYDSSTFDTSTITSKLNRYLYNHGMQIRVLSTIKVPNDFHCRYNAIGRTYMYRFAVAKSSDNSSKHNRDEAFVPIEEIDRCYFIQ